MYIVCYFSELALSPNNHEVEIYEKVAGSWKLQDVLSEHGQQVNGIDWAANSNKIVTCAAVCIAQCL